MRLACLSALATRHALNRDPSDVSALVSCSDSLAGTPPSAYGLLSMQWIPMPILVHLEHDTVEAIRSAPIARRCWAARGAEYDPWRLSVGKMGSKRVKHRERDPFHLS
jgi:hypothetical protein